MFTNRSRSEWRRIITAILAIATLALTTNAATASTAAAARIDPWDADYPHTYETDEVTVYAKTTAQIELAEYGIERYAAAGLELPHVEMWMGNTPADCIHPSGEPSRGYATWRDGQAILFHCGDRFTMLHELAHIFDRHVVSDDMRNAFIEMRGLEVWQDIDNWAASAEEHFANAMAWGLDEDARRTVTTVPNDDASLEAAFSFIRKAAAAVAATQ